MFEYEKELYKKGNKYICGVDEVGRGPLYGPVVACAIVMKKNYKNNEINDSKKLTEKKRESLYDEIINNSVSYGIGVISAKTIDKINILEATKLAMKDAINECNKKIKIDHILIDAVKLDINIPSTSIIKGDEKSFSIACASIIAKVTRDRMMIEDSKKHKEYGFDKHKGYGTKKHIEAVKTYGVLKDHRKSFKPISEYIKK